MMLVALATKPKRVWQVTRIARIAAHVAGQAELE